MLDKTKSTGGPNAYLNWLVFDRDYILIDGGYVRLSDAPREHGQNVAHEKLSATVTVSEPSYVYTYLSNEEPTESPVDVYFDDFAVTQVTSNIVADGDYYPFGLPMDTRQITQENYRFGYQGQFAEKDSLTNWNSFQLRMYDARFGRWISPDPKGQFASPYVGMGDNPVGGVDPDGGWVDPPISTVFLDEVVVTASRIVTPSLLSTFNVAIRGLAYQAYTQAVAYTAFQNSYKSPTYTPAEYAWEATKNFGRWLGSSTVDRFNGATTIVSGFNQSYGAGALGIKEFGGNSESAQMLRNTGYAAGIETQLGFSGGTSQMPRLALATSRGFTVTVESISIINMQRVHNLNFEGNGGGPEDNLTAQEIITKYRKGSIMREFPEEFLSKTLKEIEKIA